MFQLVRTMLRIQHTECRPLTGANLCMCTVHANVQSTLSTSITPDWTRLPSTLRLPLVAGLASALGSDDGGGGGADDAVLLVGPPAFPDAALVTFWPTSLLAGGTDTHGGYTRRARSRKE